MPDPPSNIRALQVDQILEVTWPGGRVDRFPYRFLRSECPCASCPDEGTGGRISKEDSTRPCPNREGVEPIGPYAVQLAGNDGHSSGLFTWDALRQFSDQIQA